MQDTYSTTARRLAAVIAIAVILTLVLQSTLNLKRDGSALASFALLLRFFTIWSNFAAGLAMVWIVRRGTIDARVPFALSAALAIVAVVYHLLLAAEHHPVGLDVWTNQIFHTLIPLAVIVWWLAFSDLALVTWRTLPAVTLFPILYTIFGQAYGALTGFYPYFFLDLPKLGWTQVLINMAGLAALFVLFGALLLGLRRLIRRPDKR